MKINFNQRFRQPVDFLIRRCSYGQIRDRRSGQTSYVRRLRSGLYPRFHLYVNSEEPLVLSLHLDQKQVSYEGQKAHSGEYDSDLVTKEAQRISDTILALAASNETGFTAATGLEDYTHEPKGFWDSLFGKKKQE